MLKRKKIIGVLIALLVVAFTGVAFGAGPSNYNRFPHGITIDEIPILNTYGGNVYWVDSGSGSNQNKGTFARPWATVDYAIGRCTANNGDIIMVKPGHAETVDAADEFDADVAGIKIVGLGTGTDVPTFTYSDDAGEVAIGAANVTLYNLRFLAGSGVSNGVTIGISVEAGGDYAKIQNCEWSESGTSTYFFLDAIDLASGADFVEIDNNVYTHASVNKNALQPDHFVEMGNGVNNGVKIRNNIIYGEFAVSAIWSDTVDLKMLIKDNVITNLTSGQHCIEFTAAATGTVAGNISYTDAEATTYDFGSMKPIENYVTTAVDASGMLYPAVDDGTNTLLNATTLAAIQAEAEDAVEADNLDHFLIAAVATDLDTTMDKDSVMAFAMVISGETTFERDKHSLEAIGDDVDAIIADFTDNNLDHLLGAEDTDFGTTVNKDAVVAELACISQTTGYNRTTDSQEAIANELAKVPKSDSTVTWNATALASMEGEATDAIEADRLDHVMGEGEEANNYPSGVSKDAVFASVMCVSQVTGYDRETDSLEAIADAVGTVDGVVDDVEESIVSYGSPNYLLVTADCTSGASSTWADQASHEVATVTGAVRMRILVECTTGVSASASISAISLGTAGDADAFIEATRATFIDANDIWSSVTPYATGASYDNAMLDCVVVSGSDVGYTVSGNDGLSAGVINFHIYWTPLDSTGAVTSGAGGTL